jgi:hypothetical protein
MAKKNKNNSKRKRQLAARRPAPKSTKKRDWNDEDTETLNNFFKLEPPIIDEETTPFKLSQENEDFKVLYDQVKYSQLNRRFSQARDKMFGKYRSSLVWY